MISNKKNNQEPIIILIGGAAGTSKTTNGNIICKHYEVNHRMGSGFMREAAKSFISKDQNPYLYNYSFSPHDNTSPFNNLYKQSESLKDPIERCIKRAYSEGTSLLIEGVNVIPGLIDSDHVKFKCIFTVDDYDQHENMITGKTHFKRKITKEQFGRVREIQDNFKILANQNDWSIIDLSGSTDIIKKIKEQIRMRL
tara:strand:+ start:838 stop:1428 length:591 start_codon:yes stop_codon:yes gene_type:complete